ncbi:hypothetical protein EZV62_022914 [Acer yangbiense]|uniref:F-box domain-containing protein n=1 Tax=Acer yangbiense TaxID=1000413 RepID=A0A5C7H030_9ROSI|nr:hypothetical protein EZV62_022914 [Acer yangbiense]
MWNMLTKIGEDSNVSEIEEKRSRYINWVDKVLELHRGKFINEFRLYFDLGDDQKSYITNWIHAALAKGVQKLELNFDRFVGLLWKEYSFPIEFYNTLKSPCGLSIIKSLRSLSLRFVHVNAEIVEFFIYNCPHLERLSVFGSETLLSLKVAGSSIQLKHLDINGCHFIKEVEISAPSLLSFKYHGPQIKLHVENIPLLIDVSIGGTYDVQLRNLIDPIIRYLPRLETLELLLDLTKDGIWFPTFELPKLRHLIFKVDANYHSSLLDLTRMIKACPFLHKFTLKLICGGCKRKLREFPKCPLEHLKEVEFIGFIGHPIDLELAFYFIENAPMLEKMIVNPICPYSVGTYFEFQDNKKKQAARKRVEQLKKRVSNTENIELPECCVSRLPDDIIVNIFSRLALLEAARTSVVSSRWRYLWTFTANLDFHAPKTMWDINTKIGERPNESEIEEKRSKYINWVGKVLELHRGRYINEFRIHFDLGDNQKSYITNWIHTALAKGVQKLELNFDRFVGIIWKEYRFPVECYNTLKSPHGLSIIKSLRSISLKFVDVNTEIVEFFIYNCPHLERLSVFGSKTLLSLKVAGSSIQLKHLDINCCRSIKEVEISAPSLLSFKYHGPQIKLHVQNVPLLLDVSIGGRYGVQLRNLIDPIILYLPQLETLELLLDLKKDRIQFPHFELLKLRHLIFKVIASDHHNLLDSTQIIKACPFLHKFTLKLICGDGKRELREFPKCPQGGGIHWICWASN